MKKLLLCGLAAALLVCSAGCADRGISSPSSVPSSAPSSTFSSEPILKDVRDDFVRLPGSDAFTVQEILIDMREEDPRAKNWWLGCYAICGNDIFLMITEYEEASTSLVRCLLYRYAIDTRRLERLFVLENNGTTAGNAYGGLRCNEKYLVFQEMIDGQVKLKVLTLEDGTLYEPPFVIGNVEIDLSGSHVLWYQTDDWGTDDGTTTLYDYDLETRVLSEKELPCRTSLPYNRVAARRDEVVYLSDARTLTVHHLKTGAETTYTVPFDIKRSNMTLDDDYIVWKDYAFRRSIYALDRLTGETLLIHKSSDIFSVAERSGIVYVRILYDKILAMDIAARTVCTVYQAEEGAQLKSCYFNDEDQYTFSCYSDDEGGVFRIGRIIHSPQ